MPAAAALDVPEPGSGPLRIGGAGRLRVGDVAAVARRRRPVALAPEVAPHMAAARAVVDRLAADGSRAVYGLTTGLGAAVDTRLAADDLAAFQARAIRARAVAVGPRLTTEEVRATLLVRLAGLARGASGVQPGFAEALRDMLNRGVHPRARRGGSLGEADLAPLAGLFLPFAGEGEAEHEGEVLPGPAALARAGIRPPALGPKDGIGLINASSVSAGTAALALEDVRRALDAVLAAGALSLEGFRANLSVIDPRLVALRPAPGQAAASRRLRDLLAGSDLFEPGAARRVQDPLSFRCLAPVHGIVDLRLAEAEAAVEAELNGAGDSPAVLAGNSPAVLAGNSPAVLAGNSPAVLAGNSPAVLADDDEMLSSVGFDTTALALSLEGLGQAAAHAATLAAFRITKLIVGSADRPAALPRDPGGPHRFRDARQDRRLPGGGDPPPRAPARPDDDAGRGRDRGLRADDAGHRRQDGRDRGPARPAGGRRADGRGRGRGGARPGSAWGRHRPGAPLRACPDRPAGRRPRARRRDRRAGGRDRGRRVRGGVREACSRRERGP